jgi:hypothetical protein
VLFPAPLSGNGEAPACQTTPKSAGCGGRKGVTGRVAYEATRARPDVFHEPRGPGQGEEGDAEAADHYSDDRRDPAGAVIRPQNWVLKRVSRAA